jgi:aryl-alcohol dehydrogenase-like predicted oxidoreductase/NAD-dependent dihydropyrimidine dehydrogenase PreA subunit
LLKRELGNTGLIVTELCFGVLPMGPNQFGLPANQGGELIAEAIKRGVNFLDTAQSYRTYEHVREAFDRLPDGGKDVVVSTKSGAGTYDDMKKTVEEARSALGRDVIDIFHLHAARVDRSVFRDRAGAFECLLDMKGKGIVRAVGISTHSVDVVRAAAEADGLDVVFPIINVEGLGILHGARQDMEAAIANAAAHGKGLFAMKALGGGNLLSNTERAFSYVRALPGIAAVAVGMVHRDELDMNLRIFNGEPVPEDLAARTVRSKKLIVQAFCKGCEACVEACPNGAMTVVDGKARNNKEKCILCGYCAPVCPEFAIRLV